MHKKNKRIILLLFAILIIMHQKLMFDSGVSCIYGLKLPPATNADLCKSNPLSAIIATFTALSAWTLPDARMHTLITTANR
jgi:hypothetical protein